MHLIVALVLIDIVSKILGRIFDGLDLIIFIDKVPRVPLVSAREFVCRRSKLGDVNYPNSLRS